MKKEQLATVGIKTTDKPKIIRKAGGWGWKLATDINDALNFLNGVGAYKTPVQKARISAFWKGNHAEFYINYQRTRTVQRKGNWGWKLATTPDDVRNFLCGYGAYRRPVKEAQIAAYRKGRQDEFYVFYQSSTSSQKVYGNWGWKLATDPTDAMRFLNGDGVYRHPVTTARIALVDRGSYMAFYIFYQKAVRGESVPNWYWKLATTQKDAYHFINGIEGYRKPVKGFEICALDKSTHDRFYVFANQGNKLWFQRPLPSERFVKGEAITFKALYTSEEIKDGRKMQWVSNLDGDLGNGPQLVLSNLSIGEHKIQLRGYRSRITQLVRIFPNLWELYKAPPAPAEIERTMRDFNFNWIDGSEEDEKWENYGGFEFDQSSKEPAKIVAIANVDMLRHQYFSEPLPFTDNTIFEHIRQEVANINLKIDDSNATGGGDTVNLHRGFSTWMLEYNFPPNQILIHEGRHCEEDDPGHTSCNGKTNMDRSLDAPGASAHARSAIYLMWIYKYSLYDTEAVKDKAKYNATYILQHSFCTPVSHSNPKVQALIDELLA